MRYKSKILNFRAKNSMIMNISAKKVSKYIENLRNKENVTQAEIAEKLRMSQQNYSSKEKNTRQLSFDFINAVASYFGKTGLQLINEAHQFEPSKKDSSVKEFNEIRAKIISAIDELKP